MFYKILKAIAGFFVKLLFRFRVNGLENLPEGGYILCPNHQSNWDPFVLAVALPRQINFMAKDSLFKSKILSFILGHLGVFGVERGKPDITAIKTSFRILQEGHILGLFPEGTRVKEFNIDNVKDGATLISVRSKTPIVPVHIKSNYRPFSKVQINIGEPIKYYEQYDKRPSKEEYDEMSRDLLISIYDLER